MAQSKFSSKPQPGSEANSPFIKRIAGSLALRVLSVCSVLIVIPLILHSLYMYGQDYRSKMGDLFLTLYVIAREKAITLNERIQGGQAALKVLELSLDVQTQLIGSLNRKLKKIASEDQISLILYFKTSPDGTFICTQASDEKMIGKQSPFEQQDKETIQEKEYQFIALNPITGKQDCFITRAVPSKNGSSEGILMMSIPVEDLISSLAPMEEPPYSYRLSIVSNQGEVFSTKNALLTLSNTEIFQFQGTWHGTLQQLELFKNKIGIFDFFSNKYHRFGLNVPIQNTNFSLVVDLSERAIYEISSNHILIGVSSLLLMILILGGIGTVILTRRISRPLKALSNEMQRVGEGDLNAHYTQDKMGFEINVLGHNFNCMIDSLLKQIEEVKNEKVKSETLAKELKIGHEIQKTIFPKKMPDFPGLDIASGFLSAKEVAGDFYDLFVKKDQNGSKLMVAVADAAGKGISACLYALGVRSMLRSFTDSYEDLSKTIQSTNNLFCLDTGDSGEFVTAWIGIYDPLTELLNYSSCGHLPAILRRKDGTIEELTTPGMALGVAFFEEVHCASIRLFPGDLLLLYTDGILEAHGPNMLQFGKSRLIDLISDIHDQRSQEIVDLILQEIENYSKGTAQHDDLTVLIIRPLA